MNDEPQRGLRHRSTGCTHDSKKPVWKRLAEAAPKNGRYIRYTDLPRGAGGEIALQMPTEMLWRSVQNFVENSVNDVFQMLPARISGEEERLPVKAFRPED